MLTPAQVKNYQFSVSGRGMYRATEVDEFLNQVSTSYDQMFKENGELLKKISLLADRLEEYHKDEDNIRVALLTAQRMADKILKDAKATAEEELGTAESNAKAMVEKAEDGSKEMFLNAQQKSRLLLEDARSKSNELVKQATKQADAYTKVAKEQATKRISELDKAIETETQALTQMESKSGAFRRELLELYEKQTALIENLPKTPSQEVERSTLAKELIEESAEEAETASIKPEIDEAVETVSSEPKVEVAQEETVLEVEEDFLETDAEALETSMAFELQLDKIDEAFGIEPSHEREETVEPVIETETIKMEEIDETIADDSPELSFYGDSDVPDESSDDGTDISFQSLFRKR